MNLKIINGEHFITSISPELLPENLRNRPLVFYLPQRDAIVLSEDGGISPLIASFSTVYLGASDRVRKAVMESLADSAVLELTLLLNRIIRIRRKLYRSGNWSRKEK